MHFSINMYVPIPLSCSMSQQDANTKKVLFLPFAKSKMIKVYIWRKTVVAISRSDWSSSKKRNIYHTDIACFLVPFQPSWSLVRSKLPQSLCVSLSTSLYHTHTHKVYMPLYPFLSFLWRLRSYGNTLLHIYFTLYIYKMFPVYAQKIFWR